MLPFLMFTMFLSTSSAERHRLRIGAFNVENFGATKMQNQPVVACLKKTLSRYDVALIQEVRDDDDSRNNSISRLLDEINRMGAGSWNMTLSQRLGSGNYREQLCYFYRTTSVRAIETQQWSDTDGSFERDPFIARFRTKSYDFGFIGVHVNAQNAPQEINKLADVYESMKTTWRLDSFIIGGDLNADDPFVRNSSWNEIRLWTDRNFLWTTNGSTFTSALRNNSYDRLVLTGSLRERLVGGSAKAYRYEDLDDCKSLTLSISDHYPIELQLEGDSDQPHSASLYPTSSTNIATLLGVGLAVCIRWLTLS